MLNPDPPEHDVDLRRGHIGNKPPKPMPTEPPNEFINVMTVRECLDVLELYKGWNTGQKSVSLALNGIRTDEDDVLDARRKLIKKIYERMEKLV